jgi:multidrug efflux pump subunit AcrB
MFMIRLKDWSERTNEGDDINSVINMIYAYTMDIKDAQIFAVSPGMIPGYGLGNALDVHMQDRAGGEVGPFFMETQKYLGALMQRPEISMAYSTFDIRYPQWSVSVDAAKCKRAGITPNLVLNTLSAYYGGQYISDFNRFSKVYRVMMQADPKSRMPD